MGEDVVSVWFLMLILARLLRGRQGGQDWKPEALWGRKLVWKSRLGETHIYVFEGVRSWKLEGGEEEKPGG